MCMAKRSSRLDLNQLAAAIVAEAIGEVLPTRELTDKEKAAIESGRLGGLKGGKFRAEKLTPEQRSEIAKKAAQARWGN